MALRLRLADVFFASEEWKHAEPLYARASKAPAADDPARAALQRARCLARLGDPEKALSVYDLFRTEHRKSAWADDALLRAGVLCAGPLGDPGRGKKYFREILAEHPDGDRAEAALLYLATLSWWEGRWDEAERLNRAFLNKYPASPFREEILTVRLPAILKKSNAPSGVAEQKGVNR